MYIYLSLGGVILCSYIYQHLSATEDIVNTLLQRCQRLALKQCFCYLLFNNCIIGDLHVLSLNVWAEQRQNFQLQQDFFVMFCLVFCVFTCVAPTLFKILGTALRGQSCPLDMLDSWPSLLVFKVAVSHSSSAVRVFTRRGRQTFPMVQKNLQSWPFV